MGPTTVRSCTRALLAALAIVGGVSACGSDENGSGGDAQPFSDLKRNLEVTVEKCVLDEPGARTVVNVTNDNDGLASVRVQITWHSPAGTEIGQQSTQVQLVGGSQQRVELPDNPGDPWPEGTCRVGRIDPA